MQFNIKDVIKQLNFQMSDQYLNFPMVVPARLIKIKEPLIKEPLIKEPLIKEDNSVTSSEENYEEETYTEENEEVYEQENNSTLEKISQTLETMSYRQFKDLVNKSNKS